MLVAGLLLGSGSAGDASILKYLPEIQLLHEHTAKYMTKSKSITIREDPEIHMNTVSETTLSIP